jgi:hypothetical protein
LTSLPFLPRNFAGIFNFLAAGLTLSGLRPLPDGIFVTDFTLFSGRETIKVEVELAGLLTFVFAAVLDLAWIFVVFLGFVILFFGFGFCLKTSQFRGSN